MARIRLEILERVPPADRREVAVNFERLEQQDRVSLDLVRADGKTMTFPLERRERLLHTREQGALIGEVDFVMGQKVLKEIFQPFGRH